MAGDEPAVPPEPTLSAVRKVAFWLMRRSEVWPVRVLKHALLLSTPPPPPPPNRVAAVVRRAVPLRGETLSLVSICAVFFAAVCLQWTAFLPTRRSVSALLRPHLGGAANCSDGDGQEGSRWRKMRVASTSR